jgi:hypothetical protein
VLLVTTGRALAALAQVSVYSQHTNICIESIYNKVKKEIIDLCYAGVGSGVGADVGTINFFFFKKKRNVCQKN